jgi:hypothetical protein
MAIFFEEGSPERQRLEGEPSDRTQSILLVGGAGLAGAAATLIAMGEWPEDLPVPDHLLPLPEPDLPEGYEPPNRPEGWPKGYTSHPKTRDGRVL